MRRSMLRLYGPFLALALVQALFIVAAPSKAPDRSGVRTTGNAAAGQRASGGTSVSSTGATGAGPTDGSATGAASTGGGGGGGGGGAVSNVGGGQLAAGDTSHCSGP